MGLTIKRKNHKSAENGLMTNPPFLWLRPVKITNDEMTKKNYIPALIWLLIVTGMSVTPNMQLPKFDLFATDKLGHLAAYGLLMWLLLWGNRRSAGRRPDWKTGLALFAFSSGYGILMEFVQGAFIPGRFYEVDDMIANAAGAALAWAVYRLFERNTRLTSVF